MTNENEKRKRTSRSLEGKKTKKNKKLATFQLITSVEGLKQSLDEVDDMNITSLKKKLAIVKEQNTLRKKALGQNIAIPFSVHGRKRSLQDITEELIDHMQTYSYKIEDPNDLVGEQIFQKFLCEGRGKWYRGNVIRYIDMDKTHEVIYIGEDDTYNFNLMKDLLLYSSKFS